MNRFQVVTVTVGFILLAFVGFSLKKAQCEYMAPDHVTYCMLTTK